MYTFAAACILLAHNFYERPVATDYYERSLTSDHLTKVITSVAHGCTTMLEDRDRKSMAKSIDLAAKIISVNLDFQINYKDTKMLTPRELMALNQKNQEASEVIEIDRPTSEEEREEEEREKLLVRNNRNNISSHRYLVHYLKAIKSILPEECLKHFPIICKLSWSFLSDFHWSPHVTQHYSNHLACACLQMAIETCKEALTQSRQEEKRKLWTLVNKKWNLIFCDDLDQRKLNRLILVIIKDYNEYERVFQHELNTYVIDPRNKPDRRWMSTMDSF